MSNFHYHGRRGVAALLCVYMIVINGLAMDAPPDVDASGDEKQAPKGIAYYAEDASFNRDLKEINALVLSSESSCCSLSDIVSAPREFNASAEFKRDQKLCATLMRDVERVRHDARKYVEVKRLIDEYKGKIEESRQGVTPERKAELSAAIKNLEQDFKDKVQLALGYEPRSLITQFATKLADAENIIQIYKDKMPSASQSPVQVAEEETQIDAVQWNDKKASRKHENLRIGSSGACSLVHFPTIEVERKYLTDRSLFTRMDKLKDYASNILVILTSPLMKATYTEEPNNGNSSHRNEDKCHTKQCYDDLCKGLKHILDAWKIMKRYKDISDRVGKMDPKSPEAIELEEEKYRLEWRFEDYASYVEEEFLAKEEPALMQIWGALKIKVEELERRASLRTSGFTADRTAKLYSNNAAESEMTDTDAVKTEPMEGVVNNVRSASDKKNTSGHLTIATSAIQATVSLYLITML